MSRPLSLIVAASLFCTTAIAPALAATGALMGPGNAARGTVTVEAAPKGVIVKVDATGLTPGWHGIHFHAVGDCSDVGTFERSKGHVNHEDKQHGLLNPDGPHEGDPPNIYASADGSANVEVSADIPLTGSEGLMDANGAALIIHASEDDHVSQPIGNAGARVACAVIK